ncbi:hypothetical protein B0H10DRAFT_1964268 [Mycena sp. CBHHK59/15]|nr:hypothetical protein B0H10DRAFT_1964268 [Mycena sp. CBHHK59/15]
MSQILHTNERLKYSVPERDSPSTISRLAAIRPVSNVVEQEQGMHQIHGIEKESLLDTFEESRIYHCYSEHPADLPLPYLNPTEHSIILPELDFELLEETEQNSSKVDTMGDSEAAVRQLAHLNELLHMLDPKELSQSSSLVFHVQNLLNSFSISNGVDNACQDQDSRLGFLHTEAEDHGLNISELSRSYSLDLSEADSEADSVTDLCLETFLTQQTSRKLEVPHGGTEDHIEPELSRSHSIDISSESDADSMTVLLHETANKLESPYPAGPESSLSCDDNFDEDMCTLFELYTEQSEYREQTEPFKRAEPQPFPLHIPYVHDFVSELPASGCKSIEPPDDPPSYQ